MCGHVKVSQFGAELPFTQGRIHVNDANPHQALAPDRPHNELK